MARAVTVAKSKLEKRKTNLHPYLPQTSKNALTNAVKKKKGTPSYADDAEEKTTTSACNKKVSPINIPLWRTPTLLSFPSFGADDGWLLLFYKAQFHPNMTNFCTINST